MFINRNISEKLIKALKRSPVVLLTGARQTGKTTLIKHLLTKEGYSYVSFDDIRYLSASQEDPIGFLNNLKKPAILDEVQKVPELFLSIKNVVDKNRVPGMFVLTGSANPLLIPQLGDSLAGRMEIINLFPFSQGELKEKKEDFLELVFANKIADLNINKLSKETLCKKLLQGGYPGVQDFDKEDLENWINSYLTTILHRDVKDLAQIEGLTQLPNLLSLLATRVGGLLNASELSRVSGIANSTLNRYLTLLKTLFLINLQPAWSSNLGKRLVKSSKIYLVDTAILLYLLRVDENKLFEDTQIFGKVFENFIVTELLKQISWNKSLVDLFHYRTQSGAEVDIVLEDRSGNIVGIEIKSRQTVTKSDFKGLRHFAEEVKKDFVCGIVLYMGNEKVPFGENMWALPISCLWS